MAVSSGISGYEHTVNRANNSSYVHIDFTVTTGSNTQSSSGAYYSISCAGLSTGNISFSIGKGKTKTFSVDLGPIVHSTDTFEPVTIQGFANLNTGSNITSSNDVVVLSEIKRYSSFTYTGNELGSPITLTIDRASTSFTHTLVYELGNIKQNYTNIGDSYTFTRPYTDAQQFGSENASGIAKMTLITYNGNTELGRYSLNNVINIPDNNDTKPVEVTATTVTEAIPGIHSKFNSFVKDNSKALFTFNCAGRFGANIKDYSVTIEDKIYVSTTNTLTTGFITNSGSINYSYKIRDTRGRITNGSGIISVLDYNSPIVTLSVEKNTEQSVIAKIVGEISALNNLNDKSLSLKYKLNSSQTYQNIDIPLSSYSINETLTIPVSASSSYDFYATVSDYFNTYNTNIDYINTSFDLINIRNNGLGLGIGKKAEFNGLDIAMDMYYKGYTIKDYIISVIDEHIDDYDEEEF